eukprot:UN20483
MQADSANLSDALYCKANDKGDACVVMDDNDEVDFIASISELAPAGQTPEKRFELPSSHD